MHYGLEPRGDGRAQGGGPATRGSFAKRTADVLNPGGASTFKHRYTPEKGLLDKNLVQCGNVMRGSNFIRAG